jgi:hypothetical protein
MGEYNWADPPKGVSYGNPNGWEQPPGSMRASGSRR